MIHVEDWQTEREREREREKERERERGEREREREGEGERERRERTSSSVRNRPYKSVTIGWPYFIFYGTLERHIRSDRKRRRSEHPIHGRPSRAFLLLSLVFTVDYSFFVLSEWPPSRSINR